MTHFVTIYFIFRLKSVLTGTILSVGPGTDPGDAREESDMFATLDTAPDGRIIVTTPTGQTRHRTLSAALRRARTAFGAVRRAKPKPAKRKRRPSSKRTPRIAHGCAVRERTSAMAGRIPRDRSAKPDSAPAGFVWRVSHPDGRFRVERKSRAAAREASAGHMHLAGIPIRLRARLVIDRMRRKTTADRPVRPKRTKIERSSRVRRQRSARETAVLREAANRR